MVFMRDPGPEFMDSIGTFLGKLEKEKMPWLAE
jgi:hypothetical protein